MDGSMDASEGAKVDVKTELDGLSAQLDEFRLQVHERFDQVVRLLESRGGKNNQSFGSRITMGMNTRMRNSFKRFFQSGAASRESSSLQGSIPESEEGDAEVKKTDSLNVPKHTHFEKSRSSLNSSRSSRHSFVRKSVVPHRNRAQSQAVRLRSLRVSLHLLPVPHMKDPKASWLQYYARKLVGSVTFAYCVTLLILINVVLLGVEVDYAATVGANDVPQWYGTVNLVIVFFFIGEMLLKFFAMGCSAFWFGEDASWNIFEFAIIVISVADSIFNVVMEAMSGSLNAGQLRLVRSLRLARALRSMRILRLFRYVGALRTLVLSIVSTMGSLLWTLALLVLIFYSFGVMLTQLVMDHCRYQTVEALGDPNAIPKCEPILERYWSSVPESMLTLFMAISGGVSWEDAVRPLRDVSLVALALVIFYVVISVFAVLNVVTGVFCNTAIESATIDKDVATLKQVQLKQQQVEHLKSIFQEIDRSNVNEVSFQDVQDAISAGELATFMEVLGISTDDIWTLYMLLDANKNGTIDLEEFVSGCMQLHGPAQSLQIAKMSFENKLTRQAIKNLGQETMGIKDQLDQLVESLAHGPSETQSILEAF